MSPAMQELTAPRLIVNTFRIYLPYPKTYMERPCTPDPPSFLLAGCVEMRDFYSYYYLPKFNTSYQIEQETSRFFS